MVHCRSWPRGEHSALGGFPVSLALSSKVRVPVVCNKGLCPDPVSFKQGSFVVTPLPRFCLDPSIVSLLLRPLVLPVLWPPLVGSMHKEAGHLGSCVAVDLVKTLDFQNITRTLNRLGLTYPICFTSVDSTGTWDSGVCLCFSPSQLAPSLQGCAICCEGCFLFISPSYTQMGLSILPGRCCFMGRIFFLSSLCCLTRWIPVWLLHR